MNGLKKFILFSILFLIVIVIVITYFFISIFTDEIWNYGFAYNISKGLVPYRDFNMVVTPLYSFILGGIIFFVWSSFIFDVYIKYFYNYFSFLFNI